MEIEAILHELSENHGYYPRDAVEAAIQQRETITPYLLQSLADAARYGVPEEGKSLPMLPLYAVYLLAQFRDCRAYPLIIELCGAPREVLEDLWGDTITEGLSRIIASVFDGNPEPIKSVAENPSIDDFVRGAMLGSLVVLSFEEKLGRADVMAYFAELFQGKLEREYSHVWDELASLAVDLYAKSLDGHIRSAFMEGLLDPGYMSPQEVDREWKKTEEEVLAVSRENCRGLIVDVHAEMEWWACFDPDEKVARCPEYDNVDPVPVGRHNPVSMIRTEPKISRNAPCSCGSGKKYKKCCGK
jgi:hypothetical protein